jgi:hypothetical protein
MLILIIINILFYNYLNKIYHAIIAFEIILNKNHIKNKYTSTLIIKHYIRNK